MWGFRLFKPGLKSLKCVFLTLASDNHPIYLTCEAIGNTVRAHSQPGRPHACSNQTPGGKYITLLKSHEISIKIPHGHCLGKLCIMNLSTPHVPKPTS